jgi:hypothetical protein
LRYRAEVFLIILGVVGLFQGVEAQNGKVSLVEALKQPTKFTGKRACWVGHNMAYSTVRGADGRVEERTSTWMGLDEEKSVMPEQVFAVDELRAKRTDSATKADNTSGDRGDGLVCGTIKGAKEVNVQVGGENRKVQVPYLADVTLDTIPSRK